LGLLDTPDGRTYRRIVVISAWLVVMLVIVLVVVWRLPWPQIVDLLARATLVI
jgi:hypothetical protein